MSQPFSGGIVFYIYRRGRTLALVDAPSLSCFYLSSAPDQLSTTIGRLFSKGYGARIHGVCQHLTLNGILKQKPNHLLPTIVDAVCNIATLPTSSMLSVRWQCLTP